MMFNSEDEELMSLEELRAIRMTFWYTTLRVTVVCALVLGYYLVSKG